LTTSQPPSQVAVEFSLALHNRTGKYVVGRDIIDDARDLISRVLYWRARRAQPPTGLEAKVLGRLMSMEIDMRLGAAGLARGAPKLRPPERVLHLDPFTVVFHRLRPTDIILCHDLGPLTHRSLFTPGVTRLYEHAYAEIAAAQPHMVFVSQASQAAFHALYRGPLASSRVIYNALRSEVTRGAGEPVDGISKPFLLTVGNVGARKNQLACVRAFARAGLAQEGCEYVLCGGREPGFEAVAAAAAETPGVRILGYVPDAGLNWLYDSAAGFVLPSLLEGFGIPVAEAGARGLVPLVSRDSALHEVAGDGALLADPENEREIADGMLQLVRMTADEKSNRLAQLRGSIARFDQATFRNAWREALSENAGE